MRTKPKNINAKPAKLHNILGHERHLLCSGGTKILVGATLEAGSWNCNSLTSTAEPSVTHVTLLEQHVSPSNLSL